MTVADPTPTPGRAQRPARPAATPLPPFERLVELHGPAVRRFCLARSGPGRGDDCFQETMLAALRHYDDLRDPATARTWLFSIAHHKTIDAARSAARDAIPTSDLDVHPAPAAPPAPREDLWLAVRALPSKQRQAVTLRYLADFTHREISTVMATSEAAARRSVFEGLRRLRDTVER